MPRKTSVSMMLEMTTTAYAVPTDPSWMRVVLAVDARDLLDVLQERTRGRLVVDHIYDYWSCRMPWPGFEPGRLAALPPQDSVSTSFTTRA